MIVNRREYPHRCGTASFDEGKLEEVKKTELRYFLFDKGNNHITG